MYKAVLLIISLTYIFYIQLHTAWNENRYLDLVFSIVNYQTLNIDHYHYNTGDKSYNNNHYYSGCAPGFAIINVPVYFLLKNSLFKFVNPNFQSSLIKENYLRQVGFFTNQELKYVDNAVFKKLIENYPYKEFLLSNFFLVIFSVILFSILTSYLIYRISLLLLNNQTYSIISMLLYSFGTIIFPYSTAFYSHTTVTFFLFASFYLLSFEQQINKNKIVVSGILSGTAMLCDYYAILVAMLIYGFLLVKNKQQWKKSVLFIIGFVIPLIVLFIYNYICFNDLFAVAYNYSVIWQKNYNHGILGVAFPDLFILLRLLFGLERGYFIYMPVFLLSIYGIIGIIKNKHKYSTEILFGAAVFIVLLLFNSARSNDWNAGSSFGPRYLIPAIPFLFLSVIIALQKNKILVFLLGTISVLMNWFGAMCWNVESAVKNIKYFVNNGLSSSLERYISPNNAAIHNLHLVFILTVVILALFIIHYSIYRVKFIKTFIKLLSVTAVFILVITFIFGYLITSKMY